MARPPTIYVVASDQHRNGKTLLARCVADYLMLDGHDPFLIDTDSPNGALRSYFPGRTQMANFAKVQGQIKIFDTILASPGRDYVIDLSADHTADFFEDVRELNFFQETRTLGFRVFVLFIVDQGAQSLASAKALMKDPSIELLVPVINQFMGSAWSEKQGAIVIPALDAEAWQAISQKRFSFRAFVLGDHQNLPAHVVRSINVFVYEVMQGLSNLEPLVSLKNLRG